MKFSAILATIVLAACATAIALPEPMVPVQHLDMEARSPTPVIKQTSRDEILQRNQLRATRTKERRDGSALPYPACDPNQPVTGTVWATFAGHDVSGNYLGMPSGVDTMAGCESSCQGYGGSCEGASLVDYGTGVACTLYYGVTGLYSVDGTTAGLPGSCSELASAGTIPSNCCNTYL